MAGTHTTPTFRCGGLAAAARLPPWCRKQFCKAAACRSATAPLAWNQTFRFSSSAIFAVAAAAFAPHPYSMYRFTAYRLYRFTAYRMYRFTAYRLYRFTAYHMYRFTAYHMYRFIPYHMYIFTAYHMHGITAYHMYGIQLTTCMEYSLPHIWNHRRCGSGSGDGKNRELEKMDV